MRFPGLPPRSASTSQAAPDNTPRSVTGTPRIPPIVFTAPLSSFVSAGPTPPRPSYPTVESTSSLARPTSLPAISEAGRGLPTYRPPLQSIQIANRDVDIPTYDEALSASPTPPLVGGSVGTVDSPGALSISNYAGNRPTSNATSAFPGSLPNTVWEDDDPLVPRPSRAPPLPNLVPLSIRRNTMPAMGSSNPYPPFSPEDSSRIRTTVDLPPPPTEGPPIYSPHLACDELRLISTVHLDQNHPAAAFFSAMTASALSANPLTSTPHEGAEQSSGGRKLKVFIKNGGERLNSQRTGPLFVRLGRGGVVEGRIEVGKVDHATGLEVSIIGLVNTSYYVRGQYTLIDTLPLARRHVVLYPAPGPDASDATTDAATGNVPTSSSTEATPTSFTAQGAFTSDTSDDTNNFDPPPQLPPIATTVNGKDTFLAPGQSFHFALRMPDNHFRDVNIELPPSAQIFQVGMQAAVEYVLRIKLSRKGWRLNEAIGVPIIYEPRAYVPPRRLRALTTDDALNPGWRTIRLNGGAPTKTSDNTPNTAPGVEVTLLLPSPPILFIPHNTEPPPIPFHLHFHSESTLPLAIFSDPKECTFIIRLMRVASMRIGTEKEIRRMEIASKVEIWQEGGDRHRLGEDREHANGPGDARNGARRPRAAGGSGGGTDRHRTLSDRGNSFLRRHSSTSNESETNTTNALACVVSNAPGEPPISEEEPPRPSSPPLLVPLSLDATDVHLLGQLTLNLPQNGPMLLRMLVQSFMCPEIGVSYVLEVGLQPKNGAVKEAFTHVWGGGLIEVVLGHRT